MKKNNRFSLLVVIVLAGCGDAPTTSPSGLPVTSMQIGPKTYQLEIAADPPSQEHGLMERDTLAKDHGMIFVFDQPAEQHFWMHHTRFPLDIIYVDEDAKVVSVHTMKAYDETSVPSNGKSKYAIEISAGEVAKDGVKKGDEMHIPKEVDAALNKQ